jgi:ABC-2 type transport system ATP-binding protein
MVEGAPGTAGEAAAAAVAQPVLEVRGVRRSFRRRAVLRDVTFAVQPSTLVAVVGENGSGKSTLLRILAGQLRPDAGTVEYRGRAGYCPQEAILNAALTVRQHLEYFQAAYGLDDLSHAYELVDLLGYRHFLDGRVGALSGGTRQKLNLTLALMHMPNLLLLDEPYQGFDWETYLRFWEILRRLRAAGRAVLVVTHLVFEQSQFDHLYSLRDGRIEEMART